MQQGPPSHGRLMIVEPLASASTRNSVAPAGVVTRTLPRTRIARPMSDFIGGWLPRLFPAVGGGWDCRRGLSTAAPRARGARRTRGDAPVPPPPPRGGPRQPPPHP